LFDKVNNPLVAPTHTDSLLDNVPPSVTGATSIVKFIGFPIQPANVGCTVMLDETELFVAFNPVKAGIGEVLPDVVAKPMAALLVPDQKKEVPVPVLGEDAVKFICPTFVPLHTEMFAIGVAIGLGLMVIV